MPSGRELDEHVARWVLGWTFTADAEGHKFWRSTRGFDIGASPHPFSSDWYFAGQVVEHLVANRHTQDFYFGYMMTAGANWHFSFADKDHDFFNHLSASGESMPLAVCRAALKAVSQPISKQQSSTRKVDL